MSNGKHESRRAHAFPLGNSHVFRYFIHFFCVLTMADTTSCQHKALGLHNAAVTKPHQARYNARLSRGTERLLCIAYLLDKHDVGIWSTLRLLLCAALR